MKIESEVELAQLETIMGAMQKVKFEGISMMEVIKLMKACEYIVRIIQSAKAPKLGSVSTEELNKKVTPIKGIGKKK